VVALGDRQRRDDGLGPRVASALAAEVLPAGVELVVLRDPTALFDVWRAAAAVVVVDAVRSGAPPGHLHVVEGPEAVGRLATPALSSHGVGLAEVVALAGTLGERPARLVVVGVEGADFALGEGLSAAVEAAVEDACRAVRGLVGA
jgi:hydrogenase maturation protease